VIWYRGDDGSDPARGTATVQVGLGQVVGTGARANEEAFRTGLAQFAIMAATTFPAGDADSQAAYKAMASRVSDRLGFAGSVQKPMEIISELGSAQTALAAAKTRNQDTRNYLATALSGVENVTTEEVAAQILSLQTQLQASYQVTSMLSKLTLTNYL
jgi:flagellin-like hook-associated protein FlgL